MYGGCAEALSQRARSLDAVAPPRPPQMQTYEVFNNWTRDETLAYAKKTIAGRLAVGDFIRGFGATWGLIPLFAPPTPSYVPAEYARESIFLK